MIRFYGETARSGRACMRVAIQATCVAVLLMAAACARVSEIEQSSPTFPPRPTLMNAEAQGGGGYSQRYQRAAAGAPQVASGDRAWPQPRVWNGDRAALIARAASRGVSQTPEGDINLSFAEAEVREAARLIFTSILDRNYVVSPAVSGNVTFQTSRPIQKDAVLTVFDAVLNSVGATLIDRGDIVEILPIEQAKEAGAPVSINGAGKPGFRMEIIPLSYVKATEILPLLEKISGDGRVVTADSARNILILAGTDRTLEPLRESIALFDANWLQGMSFGAYPLQNVAAASVAEDMEALFAGEDTAPGLAVRFVPVTRINTVFVIAPDSSTVNQMIRWMRELDQSTLTDEQRVFVYFAQNTKATDLADALNNVLTPGSRSSGGGPARAGGGASIEEVAVQVSEDGEAPAPPLGVDVAEVNVEALKVVAEENRNAVLVSASPRDWRNIEAILQQLDVPPLQVLLEVTIAEVTLNDDLTYGLQWFFNKGGSEVTLSDAASGAVAGTFPGFSYVFSSSDVRVALDALSSITDVDVISAPSLMVVNNQTASLQVGDQVPIAVESVVDVTNPNAPIVNSIQFRDTGVILRVTPRVNASGLVLAEIEQEVSTVSETVTSGIDSPTISQRRLSSTVSVADGQSITLGGLIQDERSRTKSGVPGVSDIPFLGALFRSTGDTARRTELLVIMTPHVVRDGSDARAITNELRSRMTLARQRDAIIRE